MPFNNPKLIDRGQDNRGRQWWELAEPLVYRTQVGEGWLEIRVPAGFRTDLASTRRLLWSILPPFGLYSKPAIVHDYLYSHAGGLCSRFLADALFRESMAQEGVGRVKRFLMYVAVRLFGASSWRLR